YGLMRTTEGYSKYVHAGNGLFTLLGFMGIYSLLAILFLFLFHREVALGPGPNMGSSVNSGLPITVT
ncbi:MAG TPA: hypothetical protein VK738_06410, partial [Terriglobales bacterium]|nr:hypothetical protein [Terriglobales bacterium]